MTCALLTFGLLGVLATLLYIFLTWNFDYWHKRGVNGPKPRPFVGNFPSTVSMKRHISYDMQYIYEQFKNSENFVGVFLMRTPQLMVVNPQLVHRVFVTDFKNFKDNEASTWIDPKKDRLFAENPFVLRGENWKQRRQDMTPAFTSGRIKAVYPVTQEVCHRLVNFIRKKTNPAGPNGIDAKDLSLRFTSEVVSDSVLGVKAGSFSDNPTPILSYAKIIFQFQTQILIYQALASLVPQIKHFYKPRFLGKQTDIFFFDLLKSAFAMRRKQIVDRMDVVSYLLQLQERRNLTDAQMVSNSMTFLLDGFETTASVITHCLLQLARKPQTQELLYKEIMSHQSAKGDIEFEKLNEMPYLDQCLHESIRLIPPLLISQKLVTEPIELTNKNGDKLILNVNDVVTIPIYSLHHDKQFYTNPEEFIPERFSPENGGAKKFREQGMYYAFGNGPRMCLGMRFALTQTKAAIVEIVKHFHLKVNPMTRSDNELNSKAFIGELKGGVYLEFEDRN